METLQFLITAIPVTFCAFMAADFLSGIVKLLASRAILNSLGASSLSGLAVRSLEHSDSTVFILSENPENPENLEFQTVETPETTPPPVSVCTPQDEVLSLIRALKKRELRKILLPLGIQQKRNGIEIPTEMAIAQVTRIYHKNQEQVTAILQNKLPEKFSQNPSVRAETA